jgi:hypothetical protein
VPRLAFETTFPILGPSSRFTSVPIGGKLGLRAGKILGNGKQDLPSAKIFGNGAGFTFREDLQKRDSGFTVHEDLQTGRRVHSPQRPSQRQAKFTGREDLHNSSNQPRSGGYEVSPGCKPRVKPEKRVEPRSGDTPPGNHDCPRIWIAGTEIQVQPTTGYYGARHHGSRSIMPFPTAGALGTPARITSSVTNGKQSSRFAKIFTSHHSSREAAAMKLARGVNPG